MKVAVVTGGARGIGAAVARQLARQGWAVAIGDVCLDDPGLLYPLATPADLEAVTAQCVALGAAAVGVQCDVRDQSSVASLVATASALGEIEAAVAVAGVIGGGAPAWELDDATIERDLAVNYRGLVTLARATVPHLLQAGRRGRFVAVSSAAGVTGLPLLASYSASKHAAVGYIRSLAADLAPTGVTANAVLPGSTDTDMLTATATIYGLNSGADFDRHQRTGRLIDPTEVAALVAWLASAEASAVTGAAMPVDGGFTG